MAPRGAALHRRRRRGELGHLPLPHRRRRALRGVGGRGFRRHDPISWPAAGSRRRWRALREDARQTVRDIPAIGRAVVAAARFARRNRGGDGAATAPPAAARPSRTNSSRSRRQRSSSTPTSGTPAHTLSAAPATRCSRHWRPASPREWDGSPQTARSTLTLPVNERTAGDTRANAITNVDITVDPAPATTDLREIRAAIKQALIRSQEVHQRAVGTAAPRSSVAAVAGQAMGRCFRQQCGQRRLIQPRCGQPGRLPARRHSRRPLRHEASRPGRDQGDHAPARRIAGVAVGKNARTGLRFGPCISAGLFQLE